MSSGIDYDADGNLLIYMPDDLKEPLEKGDKKRAGEIVLSMVAISAARISKNNPFLSDMLSETSHHRYVSYELPAPAAVSVTDTGLEQKLNLFVNPQYVWRMFKDYKRPLESFDALMIHEMSHLLYNHQARFLDLAGKTNDHETANIAEDAIINENPEIRHSELVSTTGVTFDRLNKKYHTNYNSANIKKMIWEPIYYDLMKAQKDNPPQQSQNQNQNQGQGSQDSGNQSSGPSDRAEGKDLTKAPLAQAPHAQGGGTSGGFQRDMDATERWPSDVKKQAEKAITDKAQLTNAIAHAVKEALKLSGENASSLKSRGLISGDIVDALSVEATDNSRMKLSDLYRQGSGRLTKERVTNHSRYRLNTSRFVFKHATKRAHGQNIVAYVDTSGSMSLDEIKYAISEVLSSVKSSRIPVTLKTFDTSVHASDTRVINTPNDLSDLAVTGRGGTIVQSVFDDISESNYVDEDTMVIILSDGEVEDQINPGDFHNVIWALVDQDQNVLPKSFPGVVGYLDDEEEYQFEFLNDESETYMGH